MTLATVIRSQPLTRFADAARAHEESLLRAFVVSPWIVGREKRDFPPFARLLATIRASGARLTVLTRSPDKASHLEAVNLISQIPRAEIVYLDSLHAKLYLLECNGFRIAMLGSPNFTPEGDKEHRELAVEIRSGKESDAAGILVRDLFAFAVELMSDESARILKRPILGARK